MRYLVFFSVFLSILAISCAYVASRLASGFRPRSRERRWVWLGVALLPLLSVGSFFMRFTSWAGRYDALAWVGFGALGFYSLLFTFVVLRDLGWWVAKLGRWLVGAKGAVDKERRRMLLSSLNLAKVGTSGVLLGWGLGEAVQVPAVKVVDVPIDDLPPGLDGFRIVQLSDLHVGPTIKRDFVEAVVQRANLLDADLVAITGDLVDGSVARLAADVAPLAELRSRHGTFFVTGNHEYYSGVEEWTDHLGRLGMVVLMNEHRLLSVAGTRVLVAGVTDHGAARSHPEQASDPVAARANAPPNDLSVLLAHQPRSIFRAAEAGYHVQISGHTHGGQFFPWNFLAFIAQPYVAGLHRHEGTWIYVSRGTGYWGPPMRIGAASEITLIRLVRAA